MTDTQQNWDDLPLVLTAKEAAQILRVGRNILNRMFRDGEIPANKIGRAWRVDRDVLLAYLHDKTPSEAPDEEV